jgi:predicted nucleic acid-binding protein
VTSGTIDRTFVDTNVLIYAHDVEAGRKHDVAKAVLRELWEVRAGGLTIHDPFAG